MNETTRTQFFVAFVFVASIAGWLYFINKMSAERKAEDDLIMPRMIQLAQLGKPEAVRWVQERKLGEFKDSETYYAKLAELGDPQGMYLYAYMLDAKGDSASALKWYEKSAAEGYPRAVLKIAKPEKGLLF